jgi:hypothetical protein
MKVKDEDKEVDGMQEDVAKTRLVELWGRSSYFTVHSNSIEGEGKGRHSCLI